MGWEVAPLGDLILKGPQNGLYRSKSHYGSGIRILRIDGFYDGCVTDPADWQRVQLDDLTEEKYALSEDDIVINRVNSRPFLGKSAIVPEIPETAVFESNMMRFTVNPERILPKMLIAMLQLRSIRKRLLVNAKDAINQSSINQSDVRGLPIIVPPLALQSRFTELRSKAERMVVIARGRLEQVVGADSIPDVAAARGTPVIQHPEHSQVGATAGRSRGTIQRTGERYPFSARDSTHRRGRNPP